MKFSRLLFATASILAVLGMLQAPNASAGTWRSTPGAACMPATFSQGIQFFRYSGARIQNLSNTGSYYVVCPLVRSHQGVLDIPDPAAVYVNIIFDAGYPVNTDVFCIFRELSWSNVTQSPISFASGTISSPQQLAVGDLYLELPTRSTSLFNYFSVVCLLPPRTGINSIDLLNDQN